jgi:hypothetical protein
MKRRIATIAVTICAVLAGALPLRAQFFGGVTVFDPAVFAKVSAQLIQMGVEIDQMIKIYNMVTNQYNQMLWMAKQIPVPKSTRYRAIPTLWRFPTATNTYGTTGGWMSSITTGLNASAGYLNSIERLLAYGPAFGNIPADQQDRVTRHYATVELTDGANQHGIEVIGNLRENAPAVEASIQDLEDDSLSSDPDYNTEIGVLNKINAATVIALRNGQDTNKLLVALAEQQVIEGKRKRDAEAEAINNHITMMGQGQSILDDQSGSWTAEMSGYRL